MHAVCVLPCMLWRAADTIAIRYIRACVQGFFYQEAWVLDWATLTWALASGEQYPLALTLNVGFVVGDIDR